MDERSKSFPILDEVNVTTRGTIEREFPTFVPFGGAGASLLRTPPAHFRGGEEINLDSVGLNRLRKNSLALSF